MTAPYFITWFFIAHLSAAVPPTAPHPAPVIVRYETREACEAGRGEFLAVSRRTGGAWTTAGCYPRYDPVNPPSKLGKLL